MGLVLCLREGAVKEEKFLYIRKTPHGQELGGGLELQNLKGEQGNKFLEGKTERIHQVVLIQNFPAKILFTLAQ